MRPPELSYILVSYAERYWATMHPIELICTLLNYPAPYWATLHPIWATQHPTLLLKLLTPSPYSLLDHGRMHCYDRINFSVSSHVFNQPQEWIKSSATITGWFSVLRTQNRHPLHATNEYRKWSIYRMISCWKNPLSTELFDDIILRLTFCT